MPKIYVYTRVSTPDQEAALAQQDRAAMAYARMVLETYDGITDIVGPLKDKASAFKLHFHQRPTGKAICAMLQPGDHIVFARIDRFTRICLDFEQRIDDWRKRGITLHFADNRIDMSTSAGRAMARNFSTWSAYFSESLSERMKASYRERYVYGTKVAPSCTVLLKTVSRRDKGLPDVQVVNRQAISYLRYVMICRLRHLRETGRPLSWDGCADALEEARVRHGDLDEYRPPHKRRDWRAIQIVKSLRTIRTTQLPPLRGARITQSLIHGPDPFDMGHAIRQGKIRNPRNVRRRESVYQHYRQLVADNKITDSRAAGKPAKRWSIAFDRCQQCGTTDYKHFSKGLCLSCYQSRRQRNNASV